MKQTLDYQPVERPNPNRRQNARRFVWVLLFMLFPTLLLLAFVVLAAMFSHR